MKTIYQWNGFSGMGSDAMNSKELDSKYQQVFKIFLFLFQRRKTREQTRIALNAMRVA